MASGCQSNGVCAGKKTFYRQHVPGSSLLMQKVDNIMASELDLGSFFNRVVIRSKAYIVQGFLFGKAEP